MTGKSGVQRRQVFARRDGWAAVVLALALLPAACGNSDSAKPAAHPKPAATTATTPDSPTVSEDTICDALFNTGNNPISEATSIFLKFAKADASPSSIDTSKSAAAEESLRSLAASAPKSLKPHLLEVAQELKILQEVAAGTYTDSIDFKPAALSGLNVEKTCEALGYGL